MSEFYGLNEFEFKARLRELKANPIFEGVLTELEEAAKTKWIATTSPQVEDREAAWHEAKAVTRIRQMVNNLQSRIEDLEK